MGNFGFPKRTFTHLHNSLEENECHEKSIMASMATDTNTTITCCLKIDDKKMLLLEINNDEIMKLTVALTDAHNIYTVHIRHVNYRCNSTKIASRYFCLLYSMPFFCFIFMCVCFFSLLQFAAVIVVAFLSRFHYGLVLIMQHLAAEPELALSRSH